MRWPTSRASYELIEVHARAAINWPADRRPSTIARMPRRLRAARVLRATPQPQIARPVAAPVVKWVGGKTKLLPELLARIPERYARYYEPFAGGAALFFRLAPRRAVLADSNADLIGLYGALAEDVAAVI